MFQFDSIHIRVDMKVGSLFSGIGGIDLGFQQSGFEICWANEIDKDACKTYRKNFTDTLLIEDDIKKVEPLKLDSPDVLVAGFPCQSFSVMGYQRGFRDARGNLFFEIARFVDALKPDVILLENVKNLMYHDKGKTFLVIYNTLAELGYTVKYKVMCPTEYADIPQYRKRIFIVAFLDIERCDRFVFPEPVELNCGISGMIDRAIKHDDVYYYNRDNRYYSELDRKILDKTGIYRIDDSGIAMRKWDICPTLKANMGTYHDRVPIIRDDFGIRKLTPYECLKFQGYPQNFRFPNIPLEAAYKESGNTVCVPIVKKIADNIFKALLK